MEISSEVQNSYPKLPSENFLHHSYKSETSELSKNDIETSEIEKYHGRAKVSTDSTEYAIRQSNQTSIQSLTVTNPLVKDALKKYVTYTVTLKSDFQSQNIEVIRRYSDFHALRAVLLENWPGLYIPNIPPKKTIGNLEQNFINGRCKLLNTFLNKIKRLDYLANSDELKLFLSNADVEKSLNSMPKFSLGNALSRYKQYFKTNTVESLTDAKYKIQLFGTKVLTKAKLTLTNFRDVMKTTVERNSQEISSYVDLISLFSEYEKYTLYEFSDSNDDLVFFNPENTELCMKLLKLVRKRIYS